MNTALENKPFPRDYTKPIIPVFRGAKGHCAYVEIATTPPMLYDAEEEKKKAVELLKEQGLIV